MNISRKILMAGAACIAVMMMSSCNNNGKNPGTDSGKETGEVSPLRKEYIKVYDDDADPVVQIDEAVAEAARSGKFVICQVGGNWCPWCLMFADYISNDSEINGIIDESFVYVHINVRHKDPETGKNVTYSEAMEKLGSPERFGFPVFVVLDGNGKVLHFQDSSFLEEGEGYNKEKVLRFFNSWTPAAVTGANKK